MLIDSIVEPLANGETFTVLKIKEAHLFIFQYQGHPCYSECSCLCSVSFSGESWQRSSTVHVPIHLEWIGPFAQENFHGQVQNAMFILGSPRTVESHAWLCSGVGLSAAHIPLDIICKLDHRTVVQQTDKALWAIIRSDLWFKSGSHGKGECSSVWIRWQR